MTRAERVKSAIFGAWLLAAAVVFIWCAIPTVRLLVMARAAHLEQLARGG